MKPLALPFAVVLLTGCIPSLAPLYTEKDLVADARLAGTWAGKDEPDETWTFSPSGPSAFKLIQRDSGKSGEFHAHLLRLGQFLFLDLKPVEPSLPTTAFHKDHLLPAHTFYKVRLGETLRLTALDQEWLKARLGSEPGRIAHFLHKTGAAEYVILTAPTRQLQEFVLSIAEDAKAFDESDPEDVLYRR